MNPAKQRTVAREVSLDGIGVHSGRPASLTFHPAPDGSGIRFRRVDLEGRPEVPATLDHVVRTDLGTTLGLGDTEVLTVEHVLAALASFPVDNVVVELTGPEIPIRDGSFGDFVTALEDAGLEEQGAEARTIELHGPVVVNGMDGESYVATTNEGLRISGTIDFRHRAIGRQYGSFAVGDGGFHRDLARAHLRVREGLGSTARAGPGARSEPREHRRAGGRGGAQRRAALARRVPAPQGGGHRG